MGLRRSFSIFATSHAKRLFLFEKTTGTVAAVCGNLRLHACGCLR